MNFKNARVLLTGADGGIGHHITKSLLSKGAKLGLVGLSQSNLDQLKADLAINEDKGFVFAADLTDTDQRNSCIEKMISAYDGIDVLINLAGMNYFGHFEEQDASSIEKLMQVNTIAPMLLTQAVLPFMLKQKKGSIVTVGSTFGSIGFSCFTSYSTSKFALRGFSQALRRELYDTGVSINYIAPRAVDTPLNPPAVYEMAKEIKMTFDSPEWVATKIIDAVENDKKETYLGFPESLFARINGIFPSLVDKSLNKQNAIMRKYAAS